MRRTVESVAAASVGAALAASLLPRRFRWWGAAVAAANGLISGRRGTYDWSRAPGRAAFLLDSTWGIAGTAAGVALTTVQLRYRDRGYREDLSRRRNRHVYAGGFRMSRTFAITYGQVVSNAGGLTGLDGDAGARRRRLLDRHEELHIWQQRAFGLSYPVVYGAWTAGAALAGGVVWLRRGGDLARTVMTLAYYDNPFEYWAYRNDRYWPPTGADPSLAWRARAMAPSTPLRSPSPGGTT